MDNQAVKELENEWNLYRQGESEQLKLFSQNVRLALVLMAIRMAGAQFGRFADDIRRDLIARQLPNGSWGEWWVSGGEHDEIGKTLASSMVVLGLSLRAPGSSGVCDVSVRWASNQSPLPMSGAGKSKLDAVIHTLAVVVNRQNDMGEFYRILKSAAWRDLMQEGDYLAVHFYDYKWRVKKRLLHGREYVIAPVNLLAGIASLQCKQKTLASLVGLDLANAVAKSMVSRNGLYIVGEGARASSLNQAWASILIAGSSLQFSSQKGLRVILILFKKRKNKFFDKWFPAISVCLGTFLSAFAPDVPIAKGGAAVLLIILGWITSNSISLVWRRS
ncbi:hypothetical protein JR064_12240 [Xanthomonas sp. CFBP 8703]|uniref:Uncharacterized protein n=1 Tax=Xanthomonas bonasiae TaxID=2810351 RepID=A0ABS3B5S2_9XANT|nr:hypothetical protein [Xanthomonas bonasiae]